jgi:hypothetical protein
VKAKSPDRCEVPNPGASSRRKMSLMKREHAGPVLWLGALPILASCARINAWGEEGSGAGLTTSVKPAFRNQESAMSHSGTDCATA